MGFVLLATFLAIFGDFEISTVNPWTEFGRMLLGIVTPDFLATEHLTTAILNTIAFAFVGVAVGNSAGFFLALAFRFRIVRVGSAFIRAVHELFWALIFLQIFGLTPLTGVLAIAIPYAGIFAKVYSEILEESDQAPLKAVPKGSSSISVFMFVRLPDAWTHFKTYTMYRLECGLRSSAVIGFVGLPTIGFHLETAFAEGSYSQAAALLLLFYVIIATLRLWVRQKLVPLYLIAAVILLPWGGEIASENIVRFLTEDIIPHPIRIAENFGTIVWADVGKWFSIVVFDQALPGIISTVVLTQIALVATALCTLAFFPLISPHFFGRFGRTVGHIGLVVTRSTPEYILALVFLLLWGPSMLPAVVALALHNGAIIGHLMGRYTETMKMRPDKPKGLNLYFYDILPRIYPQTLAYLFYRWEVIMRETAILGILGIATLGFYIDSAFAELRFDRALVLIFITAVLNLSIDAISRTVRARLKLRTRPEAV